MAVAQPGKLSLCRSGKRATVCEAQQQDTFTVPVLTDAIEIKPTWRVVRTCSCKPDPTLQSFSRLVLEAVHHAQKLVSERPRQARYVHSQS